MADAAELDNPLPNQLPLPSDLPTPRLITPRAALRRSLIVWGWGQIASGDRRGWLGPLIQIGALVGLYTFARQAVQGTNAPLVFLAGVAVVAAWIAIPVHAHRRAARRRLALDLPPGPAGGLELLWLAPIIVLASTALWSTGGRLGDPAIVLADYVTDWQSGRPGEAIQRFDIAPGTAEELAGVWDRQLAGLRNDLLHLAAVHGVASGIDPERPFSTIRWTPRTPADARSLVVDIEVVREESVRSQLFGLLPSTSQRFTTVARLGTARLELVDLPVALAGGAWRIVTVDVGGVSVGRP